jgi:hypothetical protein
MIAIVIEYGISNVADILSKQIITPEGIVLFIVIAAIYVVGQYLILQMIKAKNRESKVKIPFSRLIDKVVTVVNYVLAAIMVFVVFQIVVIAHFYTNLLSMSTALSYGLAILLMSILAYQFLTWFKVNKSLVVLLYGLAAAAFIVNGVDTIVYYDAILLGKPLMTSPQSQVIFQTGFTPGTAMSVVNIVQTYSLNGYFLLMWGGTILLLRHNIKRVGRVKFWILVSFPVVFFLSYEVSYYQTFYPSSPVTTAISSNLMLPIWLDTYAITVSGVLFGIGFRSVSRSVSQHSHVRDYMIFTAYGFILFLTSANATVLQAAYPPFGLASVSLVGLASFLILTGLYNSAISIAHDVEIRKSIRSSTLQQSSKILDSMGTAQMIREIEQKVMQVSKDTASRLAEQSGVEPSLSDEEMRSYLDYVVEEIVKVKRLKE